MKKYNTILNHVELFHESYRSMRGQARQNDELKPLFEEVNPEFDDRVSIEEIDGIELIVIQSRMNY